MTYDVKEGEKDVRLSFFVFGTLLNYLIAFFP